jgi:cellulose synthase/poly-beta-1,6-N-acetylglucosamine synthase-like glycosyltransferase
METLLKQAESVVDSCLGANGSIYAIKAELFPHDIPDNTIVDDFVIGMKIREKGFRMVYAPAAMAEEAFPSSKDEWKRRVRIGAGDYQSLAICGKCLGPGFGAFSWIFFSHKVLRWFTPHLLLALIVCCFLAVAWGGRESVVPASPTGCAAACRVQVSGWVLAGVLTFLLLALAGTRVRALAVFRHFVVMQAALFAGFLRFCRGNLRGSWDRTPRGGKE